MSSTEEPPTTSTEEHPNTSTEQQPLTSTEDAHDNKPIDPAFEGNSSNIDDDPFVDANPYSTTEEAHTGEATEDPTEEAPQSSTHDGNCQCGAVRFTVTLTPSLYEQNVSSCDCSICTRNGYLLVYPLDKDVTWHQGYEELSEYKFANEKIAHKFCPKCGTSTCAKSTNPEFFFDHTAINVRTLKDVDIDGLRLHKYPGSATKPDYAI